MKGRRPIDLTGQRYGRIVVVEHVGYTAKSRQTRWLCHCDCGSDLVVTGSNLRTANTTSCGCFRRERMALIGRASRGAIPKGDIGYGAAHMRVKRTHGAASDHLCIDCLGSACDWSYDHADTDELIDPRGRAYSLRPEHYWPRCRTCHIAYDSTAMSAVAN